MQRTMAMLGTLALIFSMGGCSDDTKPTADQQVKVEAGTPTEGGVKPDGGGGDGAVVVNPCKGKTDGTDCSAEGLTGFICLGEQCVASTCGDKYVDSAASEECDDGNDDATDGCNFCKFNCKVPGDCDDQNTCSGTEGCDTATHKCTAGTPAGDSTACTLTGGGAGVCKGGICVTAGCGNSIKDGTEACDDGNTTDGDGCDNDCTYSCSGNADCDDLDACNGAETCDTATTHACVKGTALACDDSKTCTTDSCDPTAGCVNTPIDADKDGKSCDDDCNDADPAIYVGAPECADGKDNDCDNKTDEAPLAPGTCWQDQDKDTYAWATAATISGCSCPVGYTNRQPLDLTSKDCGPQTAEAHPGQTGWYSTSFCAINCPGPQLCLCPIQSKSYDWDCNGTPEKRWPNVFGTCLKLIKIGGGFACKGEGWKTSVPNCGATAVFKTCVTGTTTCLVQESDRKQECH